MGNPNDPLNTFWQLFFHPAGGGSWTNQVEATATATNGGLILAVGPAPTRLAVGIRPSQNLTYTPLIATDDAGTSWTNGLIDGGIAAVPDALALSTGGAGLAVVAGPNGTDRLLTSLSGLSTWRQSLTTEALHQTTCAPSEFTAVAYLGAEPVLGVRCTHQDASSLFALSSSSWQPAVPPALGGRQEVLAVDPTGSGAAALIGLSGNEGDSLVASWIEDGAPPGESASLPVPDDQRLVSYGPTGTGGFFALLKTTSGAEQLYTIAGGGQEWQQLPSPPPSTATVAFLTRGNLEALETSNTLLTVAVLNPTGSWVTDQTINVPIQFGSSS